MRSLARQVPTALGAALAAGLLAGCSGSSVPLDGPLGDSPPAASSGQCGALNPHEGSLLGGLEFGNRGGAMARITGVWLSRPRRLRLLGAWLMPVAGGAVGLADYPPPLSQVPAWTARVRAKGATIAPMRSPRNPRQYVSLVVRLAPVGRTGTARSVMVGYTEAGRSYRYRDSTKWIITRGRCPG